MSEEPEVEWSMLAGRPGAAVAGAAQLQLDLGLEPWRPGRRALDLPPPDLHPAWLEELRLLRAMRAPDLDRPGLAAEFAARTAALEQQLSAIPATTRAGVIAQAELICDLAWNQLIAATARQVLAGIRRLWPAEAAASD